MLDLRNNASPKSSALLIALATACAVFMPQAEASSADVGQIRAETVAKSPWFAVKRQMQGAHPGPWIIEGGIGSLSSSVIVLSLYIDTKAGEVISCEVLESPNTPLARFAVSKLRDRRFNPVGPNEGGGLIETRVVLEVVAINHSNVMVTLL